MISKLQAAAIGALLALPLCVQAQPTRSQADPADPDAPVPPIVHTPLDQAAAQAPRAEQASPDRTWRAANEAVGGASAHAGHGAAQEKAAHPPAPADHSKHH